MLTAQKSNIRNISLAWKYFGDTELFKHAVGICMILIMTIIKYYVKFKLSLNITIYMCS